MGKFDSIQKLGNEARDGNSKKELKREILEIINTVNEE